MNYEFTDTHAHLYLDAFEKDLEKVIDHALTSGVKRIFLPNLDSSTVVAMNRICGQYKGVCFPMIGLHPTSVKENYNEELKLVKEQLKNNHFIAVGEIGIDLYWDRSFLYEQQSAFEKQLNLAKENNLPVVIHARESFDEIFVILDQKYTPELTGVFHSFTGNIDQAKKILSYDFYIGINGIVTFKNSGLDNVVKEIPLDRLLIETDAPFLAPVPYRGKRNESSYVTEVAKKIAGIKELELEELANITTRNALSLFTKAF
ncbi:MAG: TatD family hydrolase [Bacteroidales bacterium]